MKVPVINAIFALIVHLGALVLMLVVFKMNVYAVVFANILFAFIMCVLNGRAMKKYIKGYRQEIVRTFIIPAACSIVMGAVVFGVYKGVMFLIKSNAVAIMLSILLGVFVYFVSMIITGGITEKDMRSMPKGGLMIKFSKKLHLI